MELLRSNGTFQPMKIWITDYAPKSLDDVIGNTQVRDVLSQFIKSEQIPNIILTGNHGTCKRTFARLVAQGYLGDDYARGCLPIDGAFNRGKDVIACNNTKKVNEKTAMSTQNVLSFARTIVLLKNKKKKIVIIYNFEDMTGEAQNALRRIIETYESTTRFILICNKLDNIIEAIQSRCVPLVTRILAQSDTLKLITQLRERNNLPPLDSDIIKIISILSTGDMKKIINYVQTISVLDNVNIEIFHRIFNVPPLKVLEQMLLENQSTKTQPKVLDRLTFLLDQGYTYGDILEMLSKILAYEEIIPDNVRFQYLGKLSEYYYQMSQQTHNIHLYALFSEFADITNTAQPI